MLKQILWSKSTDFHPVLRYMETECIKNTTFPVQTWNVYNSTLDNDPRTNNYSEGNNNALNWEVACSHPSLPRLLQSLEYFNSDTKQSILRIITGQHSGMKRNEKSLELQQKLVNAVQLYGLISVDMYCRSLGNLNS